MTREATSQGRRGGIFLASRVFFLAMFAVVALRSTTVLATMESVSGDTAVDRGGDVAHIRGRKLTQQTGPYTYSFTVNAVNDHSLYGPWPFYVKLDGVMPSVDQFTVHVAPDRELCTAGTGGSCVAGVAGFIDGDELTQSSWHKASSTAGTLLFSITTTVRVSKIEIKYHRPVYEPGWLIKENGVEVYRESTNGGSDSEPSPVTYTYDLATNSVPTPDLHLVADDIMDVDSSNLVQSWSDHAGNGLSLSSFVAAPKLVDGDDISTGALFNGHKAVRFGESGITGLSLPTSALQLSTSLEGMTVVAVISTDSRDALDPILFDRGYKGNQRVWDSYLASQSAHVLGDGSRRYTYDKHRGSD